MIQVEFTEQMIEELKYERYHYPHPKVQQKMEVLYLKSQGLAHQDIRRLCNISKTTLTTYLKQYLEGGIKRLKQLDYQGQPSELNAHAASVETYFRNHPPQTIAEGQAKIAEITGIHRSPNQVNAFLKRIGMNRHKVGFVPGKSGNSDKCETTIRLARRINHSVLDLVMRSRLFSPFNTNLDRYLSKECIFFVIDARKI